MDRIRNSIREVQLEGPLTDRALEECLGCGRMISKVCRPCEEAFLREISPEFDDGIYMDYLEHTT